MSDTRCHYCNRTAEEIAKPDPFRPYGPGGATVCFGCATATPERDKQTGRAFAAQLEASEVIGSGVAVLGDGPVRPATLAEQNIARRATGEPSP